MPRSKETVALSEATAPELTLVAACRTHKIHLPCSECGDCVGGLGRGLLCKSCKLVTAIYNASDWDST